MSGQCTEYLTLANGVGAGSPCDPGAAWWNHPLHHPLGAVALHGPPELGEAAWGHLVNVSGLWHRTLNTSHSIRATLPSHPRGAPRLHGNRRGCPGTGSGRKTQVCLWGQFQPEPACCLSCACFQAPYQVRPWAVCCILKDPLPPATPGLLPHAGLPG